VELTVPDFVPAAHVPGPMSPCINVCALDALGRCSGCLRTREEIAGWLRMSAAEQWALIERLETRRAGLDGGPR
jgi:predicted Fe-S protein YdhL (DUF1289 family)